MLAKLQEEMKQAMKSGNKPELTALRNLIGSLKAAQIDKGDVLTNDESVKIVKTAAKRIKDSIDQYQKGNRQDLADIEAFELTVVDRFLPESMGSDDIRNFVKQAISDMQASSMADMGKVMGATMKLTGGDADGKVVQQIVREELAA